MGVQCEAADANRSSVCTLHAIAVPAWGFCGRNMSLICALARPSVAATRLQSQLGVFVAVCVCVCVFQDLSRTLKQP